MEELREKIARIDENVMLLRKDVAPLGKIVQQNSLDIALLKNDEKWKKGIFSGFIGLLGVVVGALAEFLRK
jgi:hypothetical protein